MTLNPRMPFQLRLMYVPPTDAEKTKGYGRGFLVFVDQTGEVCYRWPIHLHDGWMEFYLLLQYALEVDRTATVTRRFPEHNPSDAGAQDERGYLKTHMMAEVVVRVLLGQTEKGTMVRFPLANAEDRDYFHALSGLLLEARRYCAFSRKLVRPSRFELVRGEDGKITFRES